ncbi:MAG TPA: hypothetical protein VN867_11525 [Candidatus Binataceae bacterium]|nr:hypothetical protein [Candidatus Binataceae bacterium]
MSFKPHRLAIPTLFLLLLVMMWAVSRLEFVPHQGLEIVPAQAISGDEPHYLMVINSILFDHDLELKDDYKRVAAGSIDAGALFRGVKISHQSILIDGVSGEHYRWLGPAFRWRNRDGSYHPWMIGIAYHLVPEAEVTEVSSHPVAFPALMAAVIAPFRPQKDQVESYCGIAMVLFGWLGVILTYLIALRVGLTRSYAMIAVAVLVCSPWLAYSRSFFSEVPIGVALCLALLLYIAEMPALSALAVAVAIFMKPLSLVIGLGFAVDLALARRWRSLAKFSIVLGISIGCLMWFNYWLAKTAILPPRHVPPPLPAGLPAGVASENPQLENQGILMSGLGNLIDFEFGLLTFAPWALFAFWSIARERGRADTSRDRLAMFFPVLLFFLQLTTAGLTYHLTPGYCYGPRYWVPLLPWLAIAFARFFQTSATWARWSLASVALVGALISVSGALRYPHLFGQTFYASLSMHQAKTWR